MYGIFQKPEDGCSIGLNLPFQFPSPLESRECNDHYFFQMVFNDKKIMNTSCDPKRIQRRLRTTKNLQKKLRKLRMASTDREREKIKSPQNSMKLTSSRRACHDISNDIKISSNGIMDQKISAVKFLVNLA